jgi:predicted nucleotidyltransferase
MSFAQKWKNYQRLTEAKEQSQLTSPFQKKMKARRRRNGKIYTKGGNVKSFGVSSLRFEGLKEKVDQQALKSFEVNDTLEPEVWEDERLIAEVREALLKIVNDFLIDLPFDIEPEDITLTGSLANYNWSKYSDIDLHIVLDFATVDENVDLVRELFRNLQMNWNTRHDIYMKGYEVEIYFQDSQEPHLSTGIYSIQNDDWLVKPEKEAASIDYANIEKKAEDIVDRISHIEQMMADEEGDTILDAIDRLKTKIRNMRQTGLEGAGQYSVENLAFKVLRRSEELKRLSDLKAKAYDEFMTISQ